MQYKNYIERMGRKHYLKRAFKAFKSYHREADIRKIEDRVRNVANEELETVSMKY